MFFSHQSILESSAEVKDVEETAEAFGHLSVDENKEVCFFCSSMIRRLIVPLPQFRYHGPASGLPLLAQSSGRKDSDNQQIQRIWSAHDLSAICTTLTALF